MKAGSTGRRLEPDGPAPRVASSAVLLLCMATVAAVALIPDWPHRHLDDPSYWGVIGYGLIFALLVLRRKAAWRAGGPNRRLLLAFLVGLPLIYVANRLRFGGSEAEMAVELGGLGIWAALAWFARRSDAALWLGCVAHSLWDALHFGRVGFVPDWYVAACLAVDVGLGAYVILNLRDAGPEQDRPPSDRAWPEHGSTGQVDRLARLASARHPGAVQTVDEQGRYPVGLTGHEPPHPEP